MKKEFLEFHAEFCKTFSNPKRLEILDLLILGELTADEIAAKLSLSKTSVYQHARLMRMMRILKTRKNGTELYYLLANNKIAGAYRLMQDVLVQVMKGSVDTAKEAVASMKGTVTPWAKITKNVSVMCFYFNEGIELAIPATYYKEIVIQTETNLTF